MNTLSYSDFQVHFEKKAKEKLNFPEKSWLKNQLFFVKNSGTLVVPC